MKWVLCGIVAAAAVGASAGAGLAEPPDPRVLSFTLPDQVVWKGDPSKGPQTVNLWGDPDKPGPYAILVRWPPHHMSRPHTHPYDRHVTVISGVWWVGTGKVYDPDKTVPMPAGSIVTHFAHQPHYDGAKDEPAVLEIVGEGPQTATPVE
jgi:hypothetical protein